MNLQERKEQVERDHASFRRKVSEYEWDYQDMKRDAIKTVEDLADHLYSFCQAHQYDVPTLELRRLEENLDQFQQKIVRFERRLSQAYQEENHQYQKRMEALEKETKKG
ncbi:hypothetical protein [Streptococcus sp. DD13]|uniref:hypothetical protein n=1 Tax=Streptococcus sp. DD13 TaxID=1777881 RepID=UPI00079A39E3|nr:hypothetical protein [Streptococcus sp. DD13]KXT78437.1 hypothetical protein STRDD13_00740 [Streptococcus sp. DD13]